MAIKEFIAEEWQNVRELRYLQIEYDSTSCSGCWQCYEVCPIGLWTLDYENRVVRFRGPGGCVACGACALQCPEEAIRLLVHK